VIKINLVPDILQNRRRDAHIRQLSMLALVVWCAVVAVVSLGALGYHAFQNSRLNTAKNTYASLNASVNSKDNVAFRTEALEVQTSLAALDQLVNHQQTLSTINAAFAALMPKEDTLKELDITSARQVSVSAVAPSYASAGSLVAALKDSSSKSGGAHVWFDNVTLGAANLSDKTVTFTITANYNLPTTTTTGATP
jgi:hypothetical protein